ncbi:hypothetical protein [Mesonia aestuariivivens]|uniref:Polysaccharide chain length determinant N-terminal domain-containing protein n=1 Tax=Mesonia aestuariivivens TaxID=2796128 RepID=A0ABS6W130_9FLAO|nr:hypothetical protein [Mesonia aestuariivivens]MBW2961537.1 hypothetical protein [Mesonia aestuariivivens]
MSQHSKNNNEEIDLGDLFQLFKRGINYIGNLFLRFIAFLLRHAIILIVLIIIGAFAGYFLQKNSGVLIKTEMIVAADYGSPEYLYKSVEEVNFKLNNNDEKLYSKLDFNESKPYLLLDIDPLFEVDELSNDQLKYYELLNESNFLTEDNKRDVTNTISKFYKLTLIHPRDIDSSHILNEILSVIRDNDYYQSVYKIQAKKNQFLINSNEFLISQIDSLIKNYSKSNTINIPSSNNIISNDLNLGELIGDRSNLLEELEVMYAKKITNEEFLKIVDLGNPSEITDVKISSYKVLFIPILLVLAYFGLIIFIKIVRKAQKLNK